ncbi:DUF885 domain-containing protein [Coralloluteibacterium thermophilus]|uniref:DUF885 domain-containing protein n=2 Tax=Coralloluteibacterium thermophilum TaxID=2707049 RepID=A0ABV9NEX9_9GAMM
MPLAAAALALVHAAAPALAATAEPDVHVVVDRQYTDVLGTLPQTVSLLGLPGADEAASRLDDVSPSRREVLRRVLHDNHRELLALDRDRIVGQQRWTYDSAVWMYARQAELMQPDWAVAWLPLAGVYAVDHLFGIPSTLPQFLAEQHAIRDVGTADAYVRRLRAVPVQLDQVGENVDLQKRHGVVPPRVALEGLAAQIRSLIAAEPADSLFVTSMARRLDAVADIDAGTRARLLADAEQAVRDAVHPGYARLLDRVESLIEDAANQGVWALPGGDAWYDAALRWNTSTDLDAEAIHALGLQEVARIEAAMDGILRGIGLEAGTVAERVQRLQRDPAHGYPDTPEGREAVIRDIRAALARLDPHLDAYFGIRPTQPLDVQPVPAYAEATAPGGYYYPPALDGSRPGVFYINLGSIEDHARWALPTLAYHEGAPGHHFQIAIGQSLEALPLIRRTLNPSAFTEGWALYAEQLVAEMGLYADDPLGDLGRLQAEMFRSVRLVVDTGLHRKRWSREQAMDYMRGKTGMNENDVRIEIDRYLVQPGQACSYKVGHLKMVELRERARTALGDRFDIRAFHDLVLGNGALPLAVVENAVDEWIAAQTAAPAAEGG